MQAQQAILFVRSSPRTVVLKPPVNLSKTSLVFEAIDAGPRSRSTARFQPSDTLDFSSYDLLFPKPVFGSLGLVQVGNGKSLQHLLMAFEKDDSFSTLAADLFLGIVTEATKVRFRFDPRVIIAKSSYFNQSYLFYQ